MSVDDELRAAASALEAAPGADHAYLARVRTGAEALAPIELEPGDVRGALRHVEEHADVDAAVPVSSARREVAFVKRLLRRLLGWYFDWFAQQVSLLGRAVARFASATTHRVEELEREVDVLRRRVSQLEAGQLSSDLAAKRAGAGGHNDA